MGTPAEVPTVEDLLVWMQLDPGYEPPLAAEALAAALDLQRARCEVVPYTMDLREAALRRAAKILVARSAPLGQIDAGDFGQMFVPRWDALTEDLETNAKMGGIA
jgi:hypothetical protein